jgi:hypothetical protein
MIIMLVNVAQDFKNTVYEQEFHFVFVDMKIRIIIMNNQNPMHHPVVIHQQLVVKLHRLLTRQKGFRLGVNFILMEKGVEIVTGSKVVAILSLLPVVVGCIKQTTEWIE